jgi:hypothetical protein
VQKGSEPVGMEGNAGDCRSVPRPRQGCHLGENIHTLCTKGEMTLST